MPSTAQTAPPLSPDQSLPAFSEVIVPRHLNRSFTYRVPPRLQNRLKVGSRVLVPFGPSRLQGVVVALSTQPPQGQGIPAGRSLRDIAALLDETAGTEVDQPLLELTRLIAERYLAPWGQCLRLVLPVQPPPKQSWRYSLTDEGRKAAGETSRLSETAHALLTRLSVAPKGLALSSLQRTVAGPVLQTLASLTQRRLVQGLETDRARRQPIHRQAGRRGEGDAGPVGEEPASVPLPPAQPAWRDSLRTALDRAQSVTFLLQAPAPHRTACLLQATEDTLARRRATLIIVPEITLASAIARLVRTRWPERVALLHSALSPADRDDAAHRIRSGTVDIVVGTRSAVFAPFPSHAISLGLIWVEQEEDPSLKEEKEPHYHAREAAWMRAGQQGAVLVLGSAHPSLETLQAVELDRRLTLQTTNGSAAPLTKPPAIEAVDLRLTPYRTLLSEPMIAGIRNALGAGTGVILFLNRKGFAPLLHCRDCGAAPQCHRCSVALTFYRRAGRLSCHYCGSSVPLPDTCPSCLAPRLEPAGFGTERVEEEARRLFPDARIGRLDRDLARTPAQADAIRRQMAAGQLDILIGTQMLFQGPPLPLVGFVGLPHADAGLHVADFRSAERTYHALVDAVGLALAGDAGGQVILQTYMPAHHAIVSVVQQNEALFYGHEMAFRKALGYPPFTHLISLHVSGKNARLVQGAAEKWAARLKAIAANLSPDEVTVMGPIPSPVAQLRGRHRWQLLVKSEQAEGARQTVRRTIDELEQSRGRSGLKFDVDVDPLEMM